MNRYSAFASALAKRNFFLIFFLLLQKLPALESPAETEGSELNMCGSPPALQITGKEVGFDMRIEYNRALGFFEDFSALGSLELNDRYTVRSGLSLGKIEDGIDIKAFMLGRMFPRVGKILHLDLAYIYNGLPAYKTHVHTILPLVSFSGRWVGISFGTGFRFTSFFGESALFESMLSISAYVNFINMEELRMGMKLANFRDFYVGNMDSFSPGLYCLIRINEKWSFINDIELLQSGSLALTANFYGIAYRGGIRYTW